MKQISENKDQFAGGLSSVFCLTMQIQPTRFRCVISNFQRRETVEFLQSLVSSTRLICDVRPYEIEVINMAIIDKLFGEKRQRVLNKRIRKIGLSLIERAEKQSLQYNVNITQEAQKIATSCGLFEKRIITKKRHPVYFVDVSLRLLCYPPELAVVIAYQFTHFSERLGFNPFGMIMICLGQIESRYKELSILLIKEWVFDEIPQLSEIINNEQLRIQKAGQTVSVGILSHALSIEEARRIYHKNIFDASIKAVIDKELKYFDEEIAQEIIG